MKQIEVEAPSLSLGDLFRKVLDRFDTTRMTRNIQKRLDVVHERRDELAD